MSAGAEDDDALALQQTRPKLNLVPPPGGESFPPEEGQHHHHHHHILIEPEEDRWRWRRRIRQDPRKLFFYRCAVGAAGGLLICAGLLTGPLPGPGGIPLILLGLAIWASEFEWAHKLMLKFKAALQHYRRWPRRKKVVFWVVFFACCGALFYTSMLVIGPPPWLPDSIDAQLERLPGVN